MVEDPPDGEAPLWGARAGTAYGDEDGMARVSCRSTMPVCSGARTGSGGPTGVSPGALEPLETPEGAGSPGEVCPGPGVGSGPGGLGSSLMGSIVPNGPW
ncbi:hypothetical protein GCM10009817_03220 [Terrabacter lapilli]|uniref:Uncharacterized protein n=1 Tax=Terrabacter lapilli TaxID=436231 RepID=A0ABP5CNV6_9MICO